MEEEEPPLRPFDVTPAKLAPSRMTSDPRWHILSLSAMWQCNYIATIAAVHDGKKSHKCHVCEKDFSKMDDLSNHIAICHEGKNPIKCEFCEKKYGMFF